MGTPINKQTAHDLMVVVDEAICEALAARGFEGFRFDARVNVEENWFQISVKIRPAVQLGGTRG